MKDSLFHVAAVQFEAAHQLPNVPKGHQCGRMHGYGFEVILHADQDLGSHDMGVDFDYPEKCWQPIQQQLHYACLNDIPGLENPTSEMIAGWIWKNVKPYLSELIPQLDRIDLFETPGCSAILSWGKRGPALPG